MHSQIFITFVSLERGMNTLQSRCKLYHFNLTMSSLYLVKLKIAQNSRPLTTVRSVEQIVTNFRRKWFNVFLYFPVWQKISLAVF